MMIATKKPGPVRLAEIFPPEAVCPRVEEATKAGVITGMVRHAARLGRLSRAAEEDLIRMVRDREELGTTALGNGIAFPHCRSILTGRILGVAGLLASRVPFDAIDGEPVDRVFLVLAPTDQKERFVEILGRLVAIGRDKSLGALLRGCRTAEHLTSFLQEMDQADPGPPLGPGLVAAPQRRGLTSPGPTTGRPAAAGRGARC